MTMVIETRLIQPKELKVDDIRLELLNALRKEGTAILKEYHRTTQTWRHKPKFERKQIGLRGGYATVIISTDDEIYGYVDLGTRGPYPIAAKNKPLLKYRGVFRPKTIPGVIGSRAGGKTGPWVSKKQVVHPGIRARGFSRIIQKQRELPFHRAMVAALKRGAAKANARGQA